MRTFAVTLLLLVFASLPAGCAYQEQSMQGTLQKAEQRSTWVAATQSFRQRPGPRASPPSNVWPAHPPASARAFVRKNLGSEEVLDQTSFEIEIVKHKPILTRIGVRKLVDGFPDSSLYGDWEFDSDISDYQWAGDRVEIRGAIRVIKKGAGTVTLEFLARGDATQLSAGRYHLSPAEFSWEFKSSAQG